MKLISMKNLILINLMLLITLTSKAQYSKHKNQENVGVPNRVTMFSIGLTLSIGGIIYKLNNK